jgi:transposase
MNAHSKVLSNERATQRRNQKSPDELKAENVAETLGPGATESAVATRYGLLPNQISVWGQMARDGRLVHPAPKDAVEFVSLMVAPPEWTAASCPGASARIAVGIVTVRLEPGALGKTDRRGGADAGRILSDQLGILTATMHTGSCNGLDGFDALVQSVLKEYPFAGAVLVFRSNRADRLRLMFLNNESVRRNLLSGWPLGGLV